MAKAEKPTKFTIEWKDEQKKVVSRWQYDLDKNPNGPILTEELNLPRKEKKTRKKTH